MAADSVADQWRVAQRRITESRPPLPSGWDQEDSSGRATLASFRAGCFLMRRCKADGLRRRRLGFLGVFSSCMRASSCAAGLRHKRRAVDRQIGGHVAVRSATSDQIFRALASSRQGPTVEDGNRGQTRLLGDGPRVQPQLILIHARLLDDRFPKPSRLTRVPKCYSQGHASHPGRHAFPPFAHPLAASESREILARANGRPRSCFAGDPPAHWLARAGAPRPRRLWASVESLATAPTVLNSLLMGAIKESFAHRSTQRPSHWHRCGGPV